MNIVLFGDSHLGRFSKNPSEAFESLLSGATVYNCSAGGFTSADGAKRAPFIGTLNPDVVIFSYGGNDVAPWKPIVARSEFVGNMKKIFEAFPASRKILFVSPDVRLTDATQTHGYNTLLRAYKDAIVPICKEFNVAIVEGNQVLESIKSDCHEEDGLHMNQQAYEKVIAAFSDTITQF